MLHGANFGKMREVDPESCAQAFKGSSSVNQPGIAGGTGMKRKRQPACLGAARQVARKAALTKNL
jgi:hypothetical protein